MTRFVSLNQFVNTWECDENDHMNVQFYFAKFDDAATVFAAVHSLEDALGRRVSRHVRYHRELRGAAPLRVLSSLVHPIQAKSLWAPGTLVQHVMVETTTGAIAATALDYHEGVATADQEDILDQLEPLVTPRGIVETPQIIEPPRAAERVVFRSVLHPDLCRADGTARDQAYIAAMSDAASHTWDEIGIDCNWLSEHGFGRIAVEMRLSLHKPMMAGCLYQLQISYRDLTSRAFGKRLDFFDVRDQTHYGHVDSTVMLLNHATRRSEPLPGFAREAITARLAKE
ncbi:thioesterase family protein [uncultured Cohaesibacter sp.]|uniref:thioesterase family protein n=1 Tax=uncultured Cohaesibacter sp. TaxID=1002546 RepID=UPI0029C98A5D|nr:thioesterase family protein [uncultured Cohaesibacter sp.]